MISYYIVLGVWKPFHREKHKKSLLPRYLCPGSVVTHDGRGTAGDLVDLAGGVVSAGAVDADVLSVLHRAADRLVEHLAVGDDRDDAGGVALGQRMAPLPIRVAGGPVGLSLELGALDAAEGDDGVQSGA